VVLFNLFLIYYYVFYIVTLCLGVFSENPCRENGSSKNGESKVLLRCIITLIMITMMIDAFYK